VTLTQALGALHKAGRIASPWRPGMRAIFDRKMIGGRVPFRRSDDGLRWLFPSDIERENSIIDAEAEVDLADAATVGCLAALAREASGDPSAHARPRGELWEVVVGSGPDDVGVATEGEAWAAVLIARAGAL